MAIQKTLQTLLAAFVLTVTLAACSDFFKDNNRNSGNTPAPGADNKPEGDGNTPGGDDNTGDGTIPEEYQNPNAGDFTEKKMLINIGVNVLAKNVESFRNQIPAFKTSVSQYCDALADGSDYKDQETRAQQEWLRVMMSYQEVATAPFGPTLENNKQINDNLYSWPLLNACGVDNAVYNQTLGANHLMRGLYALEYLLHEKTLTSVCNLRTNPHMEAWNQKQERFKKLDRCRTARMLIPEIERHANTLERRWNPAKNNFTAQWISSGTLKDALNMLTDAIGKIEQTKDDKLGKTLGRYKNCLKESCPQDVEHRFSGASLDSVLSQLKAFRAVFVGGYAVDNAFGIDDLLIRSGRQDVAQKMISALDKAMASVSAVRSLGTLEAQILAMDPAQCKLSTQTDRFVEVCAVHADVREVAFILKTEVLAALALKAPPSHQGDND